jgi:hypothetical protein
VISWGGHKGGLGGHLLPPPAYMLKKALIFSGISVLRGRLNEAFSTPGLNLALLTGLKFQPCL